MSNDVLSEEIVKASGSAAERMLTTAMKELRDSALSTQSEEGDKFFPNGIELIKLTISIGKVSIEFKIAGEKGVSGLTEQVISLSHTDEEIHL